MGRCAEEGGEVSRTEVDRIRHRAFDQRGRILRDNIYGTIEEDVWRRDFTANGLYYNIDDFSIWDFVGGVNDVRARLRS
jgi:poly(A) polymerase